MRFKNFFRSFRRISASGNYYPEIDGLRFFSIALVVISHFFIAWYRDPRYGAIHQQGIDSWPAAMQFFLNRGDSAVMIFFVVSAYVIALPFIKSDYHQLNLRNYYLRRLVRIEPPYFIISTAFFLLYVIRGIDHFYYYGPHYMASVAYLHNIIFPGVYGLNDVAWSLEIEVQFYLVAPLLFLMLRLKPSIRRWVLVLGTVSFIVINSYWHPPVRTLVQYLGFFLSGILIADISGSPVLQRPIVRAMLTVLGIVATIELLTGAGMPEHLQHLISAICVPVIVLAATGGTVLKRILSIGIIPIIGGMCYSIYLIHNLLLVLLVKYGFTIFADNSSLGVFLLNTIFLGGICLLAGAIVFKLIEQPFMKFSSRYPLFQSRKMPIDNMLTK